MEQPYLEGWNSWASFFPYGTETSKLISNSKIINASPETVQLEAICGRKRATVSVHTELLCHFSPYYYAALKGGFEESGSESLEVDTDKETLNLLVSWLYSGQLLAHLSPADRFKKYRLMCLYIFADRFDFLALRRHIFKAWNEAFIVSKSPGFENVNYLYKNLPTSSPMLQFTVDVDAKHKVFKSYVLGAAERAPSAYLFAVLQAREAIHLSELTNIKNPAAKTEDIKCPCCHDVCRYHEHESEEERKASEWSQYNRRAHTDEVDSLWRVMAK